MKKMGRKNNVSLRNYLLVRDLIREIIKSLPRRKAVASALVLVIGWCAAARGEVMITSILDGTLTGGCPKVIELFVTGTENLGNYEIWRSLNGAPFGSGTGSRSTMSGTFSNTFVYLVKTDHAGIFVNVWGDEGIFANVVLMGIIGGNGNDGFQIRDKATYSVIDQVWEENDSDSYRDSYWYRNHGTGPDGGWLLSSWRTPGNDFLDGMDEAGLRAWVPFGTYAVVWHGVSTDWTAAGNWSSGFVPSGQTNVLINDTSSFFPYVNSPPDNPAVCMDLILRDSSQVVITTGHFLHVFGDVIMKQELPVYLPAPKFPLQ
jgi:hypothetical protein